MNEAIKTFLIYSLSLLITGLGIAAYWVPELLNYVAAYSILNIILGVFLVVMLFLACLVEKEVTKHKDFHKLVVKLQDMLNNPFKVVINHVNKIVCVGILIYYGWVFTGVILGIVAILTVVCMKKVAKFEITQP
jgi:hypothetical protein